MLKKHRISNQYIDVVYKTLISSGVSHSKALYLLNIKPDELEKLNSFTDIERVVAMWESSVRHLEMPLLALEAGTYVSYSYYGILGHLALAAKNLHQALKFGLKYEHLINNSFRTDLIYSEKFITSRLECNCLDDESLSPLAEFDFSSVLYMAKSLVSADDDSKIKLHEVHFKHAPKGALKEYEDIFQCPVKFHQEYNQIVVPRKTLEIPTKSPDIDIFKFVLKKIKKLDKETSKGENAFVEKVRTYINQNYANGLPSAPEAAEYFAISLSTLKRKLADENYTFSRVLNESRKEVAISCLEDDNPIAEIAVLLGFSESSSFIRAFKSWTGVHPKDYLKSQSV